MGADQHEDWRALAANALEWWDEAGVSLIIDEAPRNWLARVAPVTPEKAPLPSAAALPDTLAAFLEWREAAAAPEHGWRGAAVRASGPADAAVMVLVDCPDAADARDGMLLAGDAGRLFDRMLAAIGLSREVIHLAAVCTKRPVAGRIPGEVEQHLGELARHHVALAAPKRLLLLGNAASRAVLGMDAVQARGSLHPLPGKDVASAGVASFHPRFLIEKPVCKAESWKDLRLLMGGMAA